MAARPQAAAAEASVISADLKGLAALDRYLSIPLVFALLAAAAFAIAWNRGIALMYALFAVFVAVALASVIGPAWMLRRARVRFSLPREARVGDTVPVEVSVEPGAAPARRRFVQLLSPFPFAPGRDVFLTRAGDGLSHTAPVTFRRRGVFTLERVVARCGYPIGLFHRRREWPVEPVSLTVLPRIHPVSRFALSSSSARLQGEVERPSASVGQELFREVREYRSGDNPRHIHWRSSAHHGRLIVKQFEAIATSESWIVLDLDAASHAGQGEHHSFERAVEIAATVAAHLTRAGVRCGVAGGLRADGRFALWREPEAGAAHLDSVLYALAAAEVAPCASYAEVLAAMVRHHRRGQQWILFDHGPRGALPPHAVRGSALWFRFDNDSFDDPERLGGPVQPPGRLADGFAVAADTDLGAIFR